MFFKHSLAYSLGMMLQRYTQIFISLRYFLNIKRVYIVFFIFVFCLFLFLLIPLIFIVRRSSDLCIHRHNLSSFPGELSRLLILCCFYPSHILTLYVGFRRKLSFNSGHIGLNFAHIYSLYLRFAVASVNVKAAISTTLVLT